MKFQLLNPSYQFKYLGFTNLLPIPGELDATKPGNIVLEMRQSEVQMGIYDEATGTPLTTSVWGYSTPQGTAGYLGPTILAEEGNPVTVLWKNKLPTDNPNGHLLNVDYTLHRANPSLKSIEEGYIPVVPHLHGGETRAEFDGYPEAWWTQIGAAQSGNYYAGNKYTYDNEQQAAPLWYHDHALGLTRLNVYAGLAGVYNLTDDNERQLETSNVLPAIEVPLVIQDKAFTTDGQLFYPALEDDPLPDGNGGSGTVGDELSGTTFFEENVGAASALPEFFGDHILVNGAAWPNYDVGQGNYTFNLLNGSDSRFYVLDFVLDNGDGTFNADPNIDILAIAGDGGLLPQAVDVSGSFILAPGDRLDVVLDFSGLDDGDKIRLVNSGPAYEPFKGYDTPGDLSSAPVDDWDPATPDEPVGSIMQFTVDHGVVTADDATVQAGDTLNLIATPVPTVTRKVGLFEGADEFGRVQPLLGTAKEGAFHSDSDTPDGAFGPLNWFAETSENPVVGTTESWQILNFTADAHPIHLHLTQFQVTGRYEIQFKDEAGGEDGIPDDTSGDFDISYGYYADPTTDIDFTTHDIWISLTPQALPPEEAGRQDTVYVQSGWRDGRGEDGAFIGQMLEIAASFEKEGQYVWHCHILSHEDHEMMRPFQVMPEGYIDPFLDDPFAIA
jgi:spore coat protein A, manganese oxidase